MKELDELIKDINMHFDNEMKLIAKTTTFCLTATKEDQAKITEAIISHPHAKSLLIITPDDIVKIQKEVVDRIERT